MTTILPLYLSPKYSELAKEVVYFASDKSSGVGDTQCQNYVMLQHNKYRVNGFTFNDPKVKTQSTTMFYAFGVLVNLFQTRLLPLDFDNCILSNLNDIIMQFTKEPALEAIDVIKSSLNKYHLVLGFKDFINANGFLEFIPHICTGHTAYGKRRNELVIRVSQKFSNRYDLPQSNMKLIQSFRRRDIENWDAPIIPFPEAEVLEEIDRYKAKLNLRKT